MIAIAAQIIHKDPPPPSSFNPRVPEDLDRITLKALAKKQEDAISPLARCLRNSLLGGRCSRMMSIKHTGWPPKLLDQVRTVVRVRHFSLSTERAYVSWIWRFILVHHKKHPKERPPANAGGTDKTGGLRTTGYYL